jgi:U32 family peptidase
MNQKTRKLPEIVSPAGNLEKLKFAALYGADAVYFGGGQFNLRAQSDSFNRNDIDEALQFCKERGVKTVFLLNSFLHEKDLPAAKHYVNGIKNFRFDAVMISDPGMVTLVKESGMQAEVHLSTQMSTLNHLAVRFWTKSGIDRIVLAREAGADEIKLIRDNSDAQIEVFVHGALCIAYSGRCLLSRYLAGRDANRGDCAQACRWRYSLIEEKRQGSHLEIVEHACGTEILSSRDLCLLERLHEYMAAGVDAFKVEGRMKSLYYAANTARIYKHALLASGTDKFAEDLPFYKRELDMVSHRPYTDNLFKGPENETHASPPYIKKAEFLGYRAIESVQGEYCTVKVSNPIYLNETIEAIFPIEGSIKDGRYTVMEIVDQVGERSDMARPGLEYRIKFDKTPGDHAIFRRRLTENNY